MGKLDKKVWGWLLLGVILVFGQIVLGGITRLTDSGLSITEWNLIQGVLPPIGELEWIEAFEKYKLATTQFERIHGNMDLAGFKMIFLWEYLHRLWGRSMGLVFLFPFLYFNRKGLLPKWLKHDLWIVVSLAALAGIFGWIMVKSGLNEDTRTWVSAYKLMTHLSIATILTGYLYWIYLKSKYGNDVFNTSKRFFSGFLALVFFQVLMGAMMAGTRAGLVFPKYFILSNLDTFLGGLSYGENFNMMDYEGSSSFKFWIQLVHRLTAFGIVVLYIYLWKVWKNIKFLKFRFSLYLVMMVVGIQVLLGFLTVGHSFGKIPLVLGVSHQFFGLVLFVLSIRLFFFSKLNKL